MFDSLIMDSQVFLKIFLGALLGAFIGLERETPRKKFGNLYKNNNFGGLRTYSIIAVIGAICIWLDLTLGFYVFSIIGFLSIVLFIIVNHIFSVFKKGNVGITSEYSAILTYLIGVLVMIGNVKYALVITVSLTVLLSGKEYLEKIVKNISRKELINTLKFAVVSFVILPLLSDNKYSMAMIFEKMGFSGAMGVQNKIWLMEFFNPYSVWFFVVAISAIGYIGYILSKAIGKNSSILLSSILGGLVSSTAVTATMSEQSNKDKSNSDMYVVGTLSANLIMLIRVIVIVALINFSLLKFFTFPFLLMFLGLFGSGVYFYFIGKKDKKEIKGIEQKVESPFSIIPAIKFGLFVLFIKFLAGVGIIYKDVFGEGLYYYVLGIISGFADVDAITQTMATDSGSGSIASTIAVSTIILAVMSNNVVKGTIAMRFGEKGFGRKIMISFLISMVTGIVGIIATNIYLS